MRRWGEVVAVHHPGSDRFGGRAWARVGSEWWVRAAGGQSRVPTDFRRGRGVYFSLLPMSRAGTCASACACAGGASTLLSLFEMVLKNCHAHLDRRFLLRFLLV
jgi:hypothetical protein